MLTSTYLTRAFMVRSAVVCAISFGLGSKAMAAESQASSMAGGMPESGATVSATSSAVESGSNQASGSSASLSSTDRSTAAFAHDSEMMAAPPPVAVKNISNDKPASNRNLARPTGTAPARSNQGSLIQNDVKQKEADFATATSGQGKAQSKGTTTASVAAVPRIPHEKIQYWNQRKSSRTKQR